MSEPITDRRQVAARRLWAVEATADWLIGRKASPDAISLAGMVAAVGGGLALAEAPHHRLLWLLAAILVQARLMANLLDGMVAIGRGVASPLGELFNEVPDRVSDTAVLAGLGVAAGQPALGLSAALVAMATAYVRAVGKAAGQKSDFCGPGAKQHRMAIVTFVAIWCLIAPARWAATSAVCALWLIVTLAGLTTLRRLWRLARALGR